MKFMKLCGMGMVSLMLCAGFASCSDDDEPDGGNVEPQVTVKKWLQQANEPFGTHKPPVRLIEQYSYNTDGKILNYDKSLAETDGSVIEQLKPYAFTWNGDIECNSNDGIHKMSYMLEKQGERVTKAVDPYYEGFTFKFSYDTSGRIVKVERDNKFYGHTVFNFTWKGKDLVKITFKLEQDDPSYFTSTETGNWTFEYSGQKAIGGHLLIYSIFNDVLLLKVHPELFGLEKLRLPSKMNYKSHRVSEYKELYFGMEKKSIGDFQHLRVFSNVMVDEDGYLTAYTMKTTGKNTDFTTVDDLNHDEIITDNEKNVKKEYLFDISGDYQYTWKVKTE